MREEAASMGVCIRLLAVSLLVLLVSTADAGAKDRFTYFAEARFTMVDSAGIETTVSVTAIDRPTTQDVLSVQIVKSNPACADPSAECDYILVSGFFQAPIAEPHIRIQHNLYWARAGASVEFLDEVSGNTLIARIDLDWTSTGDFAPEFDDGSGFRRAVAEGSIRLAGEELLGRQSDHAEIARFIL